ncbi:MULTISPECIES: DUF6088 family protein [Haliea]|jgi:hypothetical protein|uniref:DUF6088 family protein n=1 Tax=Haliea TaxID=475794 RepID=UPI0004894F68|nr:MULTISPECIES: DUF6088 family protein [Haliea]HBX73649.1 hypothetical protein [Halieaceae bacterium]MAD65646.1 hypothetical protein [Haliea sp.]MAY92561.1 hypothetical protein [Haliea sp.]MBK40662.1 hypothetical protein [Haliea sp.]MBP69891.1 hypothetical protein [Haliea sp.]|tara:strand:+ start:10236 stop:10844 length:609 start_codon:yes stop_codon:yes gene_type:complete
MQPIENKIISRIYGRGRGWAFTKTDFAAEFGESNIHQALSSLSKSGRIRRVCRGVYDYPQFSDLLQQPLSPDIDQVAHALGRKFNWRIQPSGDAALNLLGLSTQVPGRWVYLSDGPDRQYTIGKTLLVFKQTALKEVGFRHPKSGLLVHALKALGRERVDAAVIGAVRARLSDKDREQIPRDTRQVTGWVHDLIKKICQRAD